jgi:hypothetical protein
MRTLCMIALAAIVGCTDTVKVVAPPSTDAPPQALFDCVLALSTERQLLAHNSVGGNILYNAGGLSDLLEASATTRRGTPSCRAASARCRPTGPPATGTSTTPARTGWPSPTCG